METTPIDPRRTIFKANAFGVSRSFDTREEAEKWLKQQADMRKEEEEHFSS